MAETPEESVNETEEVAETIEASSEENADDAATEGVAEEINAEAVGEDAAETVADDATIEASTDEEEAEAVIESEPEPEPEPEPELPPLEPVTFRGLQKNPSVGIAILLAGIMSFAMGVTDTFFAEATGWTFVVWGLLLLFSNLLDNYQTYELNNDGIKITNPVRFWYRNKFWAWDDIYRLDILVGRRDTKPEHADMHIYHELSGEIIKDREDRKLDPKMAQLIIDHAGLQPVDDSNPATVADLKMSKTQKYHWSTTGAIG